MTAESLSPRNGGSIGLLLGAGVAMERSIGFHFHFLPLPEPCIETTTSTNKWKKQTNTKQISNKCTYSFINIFKSYHTFNM